MMVGSNGRAMDMGDPRTPMAWQHRDLNYQQSGFQDRYGPAAEGSSRMGPPSTSDRLSHRTDKSSRVSHRDSRDSGQPHMVPYGQYPGPSSSYSGHHQYPPSRPSYSSGRPASRPPSPSSSSSSSSSSSTSDPDSEPHQSEMPHPGQPMYGYGAYPASAYPNFPPSGPPTSYAATMRSARSVPALAVATWDGEPCPVHGGMPMAAPAHPGFPMLPPPTMAPMSLPVPVASPRRASSVYDIRMAPSLPPQAIYGTLPVRGPLPLSLPPPPGTMTVDRKSIHGSMLLPPPAPGAPTGIPPHLLPPMARPRPIVVGERGAPEPLPVRNPEKGGVITPDVSNGKASVVMESDAELIKPVTCCRGGVCVLWIVLSVICIGVLLAVMLKFIL